MERREGRVRGREDRRKEEEREERGKEMEKEERVVKGERHVCSLNTGN